MKKKYIYYYFIILPIIDLITSIMATYNYSITIGMVLKGLTLLYVFYNIIKSKSSFKKKTLLYYLLILIYFIFYFYTKQYLLCSYYLFNEVKYIFKYFYYPVMIPGLFILFDDYKLDKDMIKKIIVINAITYGILLLIPLLTNTSNYSYPGTDKGGFTGWFYAANEIGVIMTILSLSSYYIIKSKNKYLFLTLIPIIICTAYIGTKVSLIGLIILSILIMLILLIERNKHYIRIITLLVLIISTIFISPAKQNIKKALTNYVEPVKEYKYKYEVMTDLIPNETISKYVSIMLSSRDRYFLINYSIYEESSLIDKLFGISFSNSEFHNEKVLIEIDPLDIFIHYGIIGFILYFISFIYLVIKFFKNIKKCDKICFIYIINILLCFVISWFAGHTLSSPSVSIYIILMMYYVYITLKGDKRSERITK